MEKDKFLEQIDDYMTKDWVEPWLKDEIARLVDSGMVDYADVKAEEYAMAKVVLITALQNFCEHIKPRSLQYQESLQNLTHA